MISFRIDAPCETQADENKRKRTRIKSCYSIHFVLSRIYSCWIIIVAVRRPVYGIFYYNQVCFSF